MGLPVSNMPIKDMWTELSRNKQTNTTSVKECAWTDQWSRTSRLWGIGRVQIRSKWPQPSFKSFSLIHSLIMHLRLKIILIILTDNLMNELMGSMGVLIGTLEYSESFRYRVMSSAKRANSTSSFFYLARFYLLLSYCLGWLQVLSWVRGEEECLLSFRALVFSFSHSASC